MPILPFDYPEPFSATLGVMHYPAADEADPMAGIKQILALVEKAIPAGVRRL